MLELAVMNASFNLPQDSNLEAEGPEVARAEAPARDELPPPALSQVDATASSPALESTPDASGEAVVLAAPIHVGEQGKWFAVEGGAAVDLSRRRPLARILAALAQTGEPIDAPDLIAAGWPGERIVRHAARIRLRVAIATLRSMGLARHIVTTRKGYALACVIVHREGPLSEANVAGVERIVTQSGVPGLCDEELERAAG